MHHKFLLLLLSSISLTMATPRVIHSQGLPPVPLSPAQSDSPESGAGPEAPASDSDIGLSEQQKELLTALKMTDEQIHQFRSIQQLLRAQVKGILTPQQKERAAQMKASGQSPNLSELKLSRSQKSKLKEAQQLASVRFANLLTPEQRQELIKYVKAQQRGSQ